MRIEKFIDLFSRGVSKVLDILLETRNELTFKQILNKANVGTGTLHRALGVLSEHGIIENGDPIKTDRGQIAMTWKVRQNSSMLKILTTIRNYEYEGRL